MSADPKIAMTPQQRQLTDESRSALGTYKQIMVGERGWGSFSAFELYRLLFTNLESIVGLGLRRLTLPLFLERCGKGLIVGNGVTIRQPARISIGKKVVLDDYSALDVRTRPGEDQDSSITLGDYVYLGRYSAVKAKHGKITLGAAVNIGAYSRIASRETIVIGESVLIASYVYIGAGNHRSDDLNRPVMEQDMEYRGGVNIGPNVWIGAKATICDGVTIGRDAIVGAHSLVRENVPERAIVAGTPAKIIRYRE